MKEENLWEEFITYDKGISLCGLCANVGIINVSARSPAGIFVSTTGYCICPNGRAYKKTGAKFINSFNSTINKDNE